MSHVNSYPRRSIQRQTPYDLLCGMLPDGAATAQVFGIHSAASVDAVMKASLLPVMLSSLNSTED